MVSDDQSNLVAIGLRITWDKKETRAIIFGVVPLSELLLTVHYNS